MNPILLAQLLSTLGTVGIPLIQKLMADIAAKKSETTVTVEDLAELDRLSKLTSAGIYASLGIKPPA